MSIESYGAVMHSPNKSFAEMVIHVRTIDVKYLYRQAKT